MYRISRNGKQLYKGKCTLSENNANSFENMKYSMLQEQEYGVGLPQNLVSSEMNECVMVDTDPMEIESSSLEEASVVSNLPLLFANGHPTSLEKITVTQLERFVTFMVKCSLGHDTNEVISEPRWWPKEVKFSNPLTRPKRVNDNWMANLKKLVFRCYTYHRSEYLLRFCSYLARYSQEDLQYVNNWDSTTSLYHKSTGKLLVTFRNENMNYDRTCESPRKKLLSCRGVISSYTKQQQHSVMMNHTPTGDIYLCDNCDAEFIGLEKMKEHERVCYEQEHNGSNSRSTTPDLSIVEPELRQNQFLEYFHLCSVKSESEAKAESKSVEIDNDATVNNNNNIISRTSRRVRGFVNFTRCPTIPFSSPAGILLAKKSKAMTEETQQERLERIERHLIAPVLNSSSKPKWLEADVDNDKWSVTYKPNRDKLACDYVHQYKFVNSVKKKPMLSIQSQLLYVICRPVFVILNRLTQEQIHDFKQNQPKYQCLIQNVSIVSKKMITHNERKTRPNVPSKRKAPSDESDINTMKENVEKVVGNEIINVELIDFGGKSFSGENNTTTIHSIKEIASCIRPSEAIAVIDLCSSDEEENTCTPASSNENKDSMSCLSHDVKDVTESFLEKFSSTKFQLKHEKCEWLSDNILNNDVENYTDKYHSTMLNTFTNLSPILRPAP
ncbi:uncharacterized protein LOC126918743 isoform X1 [Bombus affinis]|uniref:uncharacterized protein LOC126918743 isoform X1 n=2 Tax=Bombus affinis TaxID=309941 RepID=UPI0021B81E0E|nr:uncharacterized protein LOC126918743 isoform X1 [Bombus affinis]